MIRRYLALVAVLCVTLSACSGPQRPRPDKPADQYIVLEGKTYRITHEKIECGTCRGEGNMDRPCAICRGAGQQLMRCFNCGGSGMITMMGPAGPYLAPCAMCGGGGAFAQPCSACFQTGRARCNLCDGAGYTWTEVRTLLE